MKKTIINSALLTMALTASASFAATPAQGLLHWTGLVGGTINSNEIGLTGLGGGEILPGVLKIAEDGTFASESAITVEAHKMVDEGLQGGGAATGVMVVDKELFDGKVDWKLNNQNINSTAYEAANIKFQLNSVDADSFPATEPGEHVIGVTVVADSSAVVDADALRPGENVVLSATIMATPSA